MKPAILQSKTIVGDLFCRVWEARTLSRTDRFDLRSVLMRDYLNADERAAIDRLLYAVRRGWLQVLD